jgi:hypothetical protein
VEPQAVPLVPQVHQRASTQKPLVPPANISQHPVEQSLLLVHGLRHPTQSVTVVPLTQRPVQQSVELVQLEPIFPQAEAQREASEQTGWPVSSLSKQQPEAQSEPVLQSRWQSPAPDEDVTHVSPVQHDLLAHESPVAAHRPTTAAGPSAQRGYCLAAAPVQKQEASSKLIQL